MKTNFLFSIFSLCMFTATAQHQLSGTIKDGADGSPVPYATAALLRPDSTAITGVMSGDDGKFVLNDLAAGNYLLQVSFIGYQREYRNVNVPAQSELGDIELTESATRMQEVIVSANRPLVQMKLDRIVVNVSGNVVTTGLNINEVLRNLPGLYVDGEGTVTLYGRVTAVYINGRPTRLPASQVAQLLNGMQGDQVDRIELIANPSARYEADKGSSIVNIILKRDPSLGINGSVSTSVGYTEFDWLFREGLNLNYRSQKLNIFGNYGYNYQPYVTDIYQRKNFTNKDLPVTYAQQTRMRFVAPNHTLRAGIDWFVTQKQTIGFLFTGTLNNNRTNSLSNAEIMPLDVARVDSTVLSNTISEGGGTSQMYNLNYRLLTNTEGEELSMDLDYGRVTGDGRQNLQSRYFDILGFEQREKEEFRHNSLSDYNIFSLSIDYARPFSDKSSLQAGVKTGYTKADNSQMYDNLLAEQWVNDESRSNSFDHKEQVSAAYATYSRKFGKFSAMAGLRAEYTATNSVSLTMDTAFTRSYLDFFPNAYLQYQFSDMQSINLSYARRIMRPGYSQLNPFRFHTDAFNYQSGNLELNPVYQHTIILSYRYKKLTVNAIYSKFDNVISQEWIQDDETHVTEVILKNNSKRSAYTVFAQLPVSVSKKYTITAYTRNTLFDQNSWYNGEPFNKKYYGGGHGLLNSFTVLPTLRINANISFDVFGWNGISHYGSEWYMDVFIDKTFLNNKLRVALNCVDLFKTRKINATTRFQNVDQVLKQNNHQRTTILAVSYSFGSQQIRAARNRSSGIEEEIGRTR